MTTPEFPIIPLFILTFFAGFACAIWLAVALEDGAGQMAEKVDDQTEKGPSITIRLSSYWLPGHVIEAARECLLI